MIALRISDISGEKSRLRFELGPRDIRQLLEKVLDEVRPSGSLVLVLDLTRAEGGIVARGALRCPLIMECSRCLDEFEMDAGGRLDFLLKPAPKRSRAGEEEVDLDAGLLYYRGNELSLDQYVRDYICLNIPIKILCREDCKGLCPACGKNLNEGPCGCSSENEEPIP